MRRSGVLTKFICAVAVSAYGCVPCPPTYTDSVESPSGKYLAATYSEDCGPVPPFNAPVGLATTKKQNPSTVARVRCTPVELRPKWLNDTELEFVFDCNSEADAPCAPAERRHWTVYKSTRWHDVHITYVASERLPTRLSRDDVKPFGRVGAKAGRHLRHGGLF
jgi:hypothetical protein